MNATSGYIYIRTHPSYDIHNACKLGKTANIPDRDTQYATGEITRGCFAAVFEILGSQMGIVERHLQNEFREFHIHRDAGTEFYDTQIIQCIEPRLIALGISYIKLTPECINKLVRCNRVKHSLKKINTKALILALMSGAGAYIPRPDQTEIINKSVAHFQRNDKGLLVLVCGAGKTLISLWVAQSLQSKTIVIGVPNMLLLKQWDTVAGQLFCDTPRLLVSGGVSVDGIAEFLETHRNTCIVITTYASAHKVVDATNRTAFVFDMKILDEAHHLTSANITPSTKAYIQMLAIPSVKQLALTATLKNLDGGGGDDTAEMDGVISNDNVAHFGDIIDRKCLSWAIQQKIICDYVIQTIITKEAQIEDTLLDDTEKRLYMSAMVALKSVMEKHSHHMLIYANSKDAALKIVKYIKVLLLTAPFNTMSADLYYTEYHSEMRPVEQREIIRAFENSKAGIITCVYCLGEGWDFPLLDAVVFAENMSSNIRIVQSALRASRKYAADPAKRTKIILPVLYKDDWLDNVANPDLRKVREIIYQMGLEDETIIQKIKAFHFNADVVAPPDGEPDTVPSPKGEIGEYDAELTQQITLKTVTRAALDTTFAKAKRIIADKNIKTKEAYYDLCDRDARLSKDPEMVFAGRFTTWVDYLSIERVYYDLETCKRKIAEYFAMYPELVPIDIDISGVTTELCKIDAHFPPPGLWCEYYGIGNIHQLLDISYMIHDFDEFIL